MVVSASSFASAAEPSVSALPHDTAITYGTLPNGMRYWIRPDIAPAGKATLWLRVATGSLNEEDHERGLAHFLEHMAFNGSTNFPAGTLIKRFEAVGLTFGAHQNATTGFLDTIYKLTIPNTPATLDMSLLYFADVASRLTLDKAEIDRERQVVLAERRARDNAANRAFNKQLHALVPGSRFSQRLPLGDEQVVRQATTEQLRAYYKKWYRPDNTVLMVAGDVDPEALARLVDKHFGAWKVAAPQPMPASPGIRPYTSDAAEVLSEYGLVNAEINLAHLEPPRNFASQAGYRRWLVQLLGNRMLNTRLREQVLEGHAPYQTAAVTGDTSFGTTLVEARAKGDPSEWRAMARALVVELKRAREHGFSDDELQYAVEVLRAEFERDALEQADFSPTRWLGMMDTAIEEGRRPLNPRDEFELAARLLATVTPADVTNAVRERYAAGQRKLLLALPKRDDLPPPSVDALLALLHDAEKTPVAPLAVRKAPSRLLDKDPSGGSIANRTDDADINVVSATLGNGVRVHVHPTAYQKNHVSVRITLAGGRVLETEANRGISEVAALPFKVPAAARFSSSELRRWVAPKHVSVSGRDTAGGLELDIAGQRRDLEDGFRLAHVLLTRAHIEQPMFDMWQRQALERQANREGSVDAQLNDRVDALLTNNDPRFRVLTPDNARRLTRESGQAWLDGLLKRAPIEVAIVGDLPADEALQLATRYLGTLSKREPAAGAYAAARALKAAPGPHSAEIKVDTSTPKAMVYVGWRGADWRDVYDWHMLDLAGRIITNRLLTEVRERRGLAYSVRARSSPHTLYQGNSRFRVSFAVDPNKADEAARVVEAVVDDFVRNGPTPDELSIAREQASNSFRSGSRTPEFWLDILSDLEYMGADLAWVKSYLQDVSHHTPDQMMAVVRKYVRPDRYVRVIGAPADAPTSTAAEDSRKPVANIN